MNIAQKIKLNNAKKVASYLVGSSMLVLGLFNSGCTRNVKHSYEVKFSYEGYPVESKYTSSGGSLRIGVRGKSGFEKVVYGRDLNGDDRLDSISITAPRGDPLEKFANLEILGELYKPGCPLD